MITVKGKMRQSNTMCYYSKTYRPEPGENMTLIDLGCGGQGDLA
jgi:hypothetical protein